MKLSERAYLKVTAAVPQTLSARVDLMRHDYFSDGPLNGQQRRQRTVRELFATIEFDDVVETGTFRGSTTLFFSQLTGLPVHSVELLLRFHRFAAVRCGRDQNIFLHQGDSRAFLKSLASEIGDRTTFFYLDAHWEQDVPRFEEVEIIASAWDRAVMMIDDVAVPDDPGYGFARYGGVPLTLGYLPELPGWESFYPEAPSRAETGGRRGCAVLASPSLVDSLRTVPGLRPAATVGDRRNPRGL